MLLSVLQVIKVTLLFSLPFHCVCWPLSLSHDSFLLPKCYVHHGTSFFTTIGSFDFIYLWIKSSWVWLIANHHTYKINRNKHTKYFVKLTPLMRMWLIMPLACLIWLKCAKPQHSYLPTTKGVSETVVTHPWGFTTLNSTTGSSRWCQANDLFVQVFFYLSSRWLAPRCLCSHRKKS